MNFSWEDKLQKRIREGNHRFLQNKDKLIDFQSNDYLGFSKIPTVSSSKQYGSTGSRLISGSSTEALQTEHYLAETFQAEASLVFNSGYDANLGLFSSFLQKGDIILYDEHIHASIRDGIRLSYASAYSFKHNSIPHLKERLQKFKGANIYIAIESYYSMHGDRSPLEQILAIAKINNAKVIVDEAHAGGIMGGGGLGLALRHHDHTALLARVVTFGKGFGAHGAAVLSSKQLIDFLINFSHAFIYTTALPPESYERMQQMVQSSLEADKLREQLIANIATWCRYFEGSHGPIQLIRGEGKRLAQLAEQAQKEGFAIKAVRYPTVKKEDECLRICLHATHKQEEVERLARWLLTQL